MEYINDKPYMLCNRERSLIVEALEHEIHKTTSEMNSELLRTTLMSNAQKLLDLQETINKMRKI